MKLIFLASYTIVSKAVMLCDPVVGGGELCLILFIR